MGAVRWSTLEACYVEHGSRTLRLLADTALGPAWLIIALTILVTVLAIVLAAGVIRSIREMPVAVAGQK